MEQVFTTKDVGPRMRSEAWREALAGLTPMDITPLCPQDFYGQMSRARLDEIVAVDTRSSGVSVQISSAHIAQTRDPMFILVFQLYGESWISQAGRDVVLKKGDFVLTDSTRPLKSKILTDKHIRSVCVPTDLLKRYMGSPSDAAGVRIDGQAGLGRVASRFVQSLWADAQLQHVGGDAHLERAALELVAGSYLQVRGATPNRSSLAAVHRIQIIDAIERRLHDVSLSPKSLALSMRMSPRNLHRIFAVSGETVSHYILRRRLERCALQLADCSDSDRPISDIAFATGFKSFPHFCRAFRERYFISAGDYRNESFKVTWHGASVSNWSKK